MESVLQPPPPFNFEKDLVNITSGNLSNHWSRWKKSFSIYFDACQLNTKDKNVQVNILLHIIGEQCRDVYEQFSPETNFTVESLLRKFDTFFTPKKNLTVERHRFFTRNQQEHETVEQYVFDLNKLAMSCEFKELKEDLVKDKMICGLREEALRERLLREYDLTLKKALDICSVAEMSRAQANNMKTEQDGAHVDEVKEPDSAMAVHWVRRQKYSSSGAVFQGHARSAGDGTRQRTAPTASGRGGRWRDDQNRSGGDGGNYRVAAAPQQRQPPMSTARGPLRHADRFNCEYCGLMHDRNKMKCPAFGQRCVRCNRMNHYARVCRVYTVQDNCIDQVCGGAINKSGNQPWYIDLQINNSKVRFKLDTGADVNVLPCRYLSRLGVKESDLLSTDTKLVDYSGGNIKVLGQCRLKSICKSNPYLLKFNVVDVTSSPVLGREACEEMDLVKRIMAVSVNKSKSEQILNEFPDVFEGIGCLPCEYKIRLSTDARPIVHAPRKLPIAIRDVVKRKLSEMLEQGVITKVEEPTDWVNSMTVVQKPNGDIRICLDPRDLNKYIKREHFRLPTLDDVTSKLSGAQFFSTLDCKQGFFQLKLHEDSTDLCTFNTVFGRFKFLRMPFGISSASEVFHRRLYEYFDGIEGVTLFVDDLLVYAPTRSLHDFRLRQVLDRCRQINVRLNREKCRIGLTEIKYLGHIISKQGIKPDDSHILPIKNMPKPENVKDLERFLGLVTYVGSFIPHLSERTYVLRQLLKRENEWQWNEEHDKCFENLQQCITSAPVLQFYDVDKPVTISVDASKNGLDACLLQDSKPVCYASRSLTKSEQNYAQIEKELYACVFACEKFYSYIYGKSQVTIETDHRPLVNIIKKPIAGAPARLQRMLLRLQPYTFELTYKPGKYLYIADALSRAVAAGDSVREQPRDYLEERAQVCAVAVSNSLTDTHFIELQKYTEQDQELQQLKKVILDGWPTHKCDVNQLITPYWDGRDELTVAYDLVWKGSKIVIPKSMRREMLKKVHIGHLGAAKTKLRAREIMFWPNMNAQIQDMISHCQACLTYRKDNNKQPLISHEIPSRAWVKIGADIFHFDGKSYLLIVDYFSKFVEVEKLTNLTSECVIERMKNIFSRQGIPEMCCTDNGPEFSSRLFTCFSRKWRFKHNTSSPRYPQSNGQVERAIQTVKAMLRKTKFDKSEFRLALLEFLNTPISDLLPSPTELLNSRKLRSVLPCSPNLLESRLCDTKYAHGELLQRQAIQKKYFDKGSKNLALIVVGNKVKVRMGRNWVNAQVVGMKGTRSYFLKLCTGNVIRRNRKQIILDSHLRCDMYNEMQPYEFDDVTTAADSEPAPYSSSVQQETQQNNNHSFVTRFGRTVTAPDRWGHS